MKSLYFTKTISRLVLIFLIAFPFQPQAQVIEQLKDLRTGNSFPSDFTISGTKLFFIASDDINLGLWVTDGTSAGTTKLTPSSAPLNSSFDIVSFNNKIYFTYNDGINGYELWVSDGTIAGTKLFKDINPGSAGSFPKNFTVANNKLFFITDIDQKLFVCDGTPTGTTVIKNNGAIIFNGLSQFAILNNDIYFTSDNGTGSGYGMWKSDGTAGGTVLVMPNIASSAPGDYAVLNNTLFFSADDGVHGTELWTTNGTTAGTGLVINLRADGNGIFYGGSPLNMIVYKNKVYFTASDDTHGAELFSSDGTAAGTQMVKDMQPGAEGSVPQRSVIYNGNLYFSCYNGSAATGLWTSDGSTAGTILIKQGGNGSPFLRDTRFAPVFNNKLYFIVNDLQYYPLWVTDGSTAGTKQAVFQNTASPAFSTPISGNFNFALYNSELYFAGTYVPTIGFSWGIEPTKITNGILPVTWLGIQAQWANESEVKVSWQVAQEENVKDYTVQESNDGNNFTNACTQFPTNANHYSCLIPASNNNLKYYRIRLEDIDGKISFSSMVTLRNNISSSISVYPNPAKEKLYINGVSDFSKVVITDATGKIISRSILSSGEHFLNISHLSKGIYFLKIERGGNLQTLKFFKD